MHKESEREQTAYICADSGTETKTYERMLRFDRHRLLYIVYGKEIKMVR